MARLILSSPDGRSGILELTKKLITVGRGGANDLVLNDASVSRFHAVVKQLEDGSFAIADRGSTNGVMVNGARIREETVLADGDEAKLGVYSVRFESFESQPLVVRGGEMPSTLKEVLKGVRPESVSAHLATPPTGTQEELAARVGRLERENYLLTVLYDAGKALNSKLSIDDIGRQVVDLCFRIEGVERGFMMLFDEQGELWQQTEVRYRHPRKGPREETGSRGGGAGSKIILSRSILDRVRSELQPLLITDVQQDERFQPSESLKISGLRSAMCTPLAGRDRLFGVLYVDNLEKTAAFTQDELNVFALIAAQAAAAIDNASTHDQLAEHAIQRSALARFLAPEVVEMIAAHPRDVRLGGSNQKVSVLFADIRDFTALSERMAPEQIVEILNEFFTRVTDVIFDCGGTLDKYMGDAVMAVFGAPLSHGNDAANASRAAILIQMLMGELNRDSAARNWPQLHVGIGVSTGIVTAGNIGSPRRLDYTVIGDTVNTASRLMANAAPGQILISGSTAAELGKEFNLKPLEPMRVKGKSHPVEVFSVEWRVAASA